MFVLRLVIVRITGNGKHKVMQDMHWQKYGVEISDTTTRNNQKKPKEQKENPPRKRNNTPHTTCRKAENAKSRKGSHSSVIVLGRYLPIECVNDLVIYSDLLRSEELENDDMS